VALYYETGSATLARRRFLREGNRRFGPSRQAISQLVEQFETSGSVTESASRRSVTGRPRTVPTETFKKVRRAIASNPRLSVRRLARRVGITRSSAHRILRRWLGLHPYKLERVHRLRRGDKAHRIRFCTWLLPKLLSPQFKKHLFMSDEAHFYLDGMVSKQNCRVWGSENPHATMTHDPFAPHITVWCALSCTTLVGPYFFWEGGQTVTVTAGRYRAMLEDFFLPELERRGIPLHKVWFQQDGASAHTTHWVISYLHEVFRTRLISGKSPVMWPPRSPDLTYPDFFLWGRLKSVVYETPPHSLAQLKQRVRRAIREVTPDMLGSLADSLCARARACLRARGGPVEPLLPPR